MFEIEKIIIEINFLRNISDLKILNKGYSGDCKYTFIKSDKKYLIRLNKMGQKDWFMPNLTKDKKLPLVVNYMKQAHQNGVRCPEIYDYGIIEKHDTVYLITSFLDGEDAESELKIMNHKEQYNVGFELGIDLKILHQLKFKMPLIDWEKESLLTYEKTVSYYSVNKYPFKNKLNKKMEEDIHEYINVHKHILKNRNLTLIYNDVHVANIILKNRKYVGLIDFNEINYSDPFYEHKFLRNDDVINYPSFCKGILDGYFNRNIPSFFWEITYLYNALDILSFILSPDIFTEDEVKNLMDFKITLFESFSKYKEIPPKWYKESFPL